jgi:integrase/recombinase XerD
MDASIIPADTDDQNLIRIWLHGRSRHTARAYAKDVNRFQAFIGKPLRTVTLSDLQAFADSLTDLAPSSQAQALASVKSLFSFGHRVGHLQYDVGRALRLPKVKETLGERILSEGAVQRMLALEEHPRNRTLLLLLYATGMRVSEVCRLRWRDVQERDASGGGANGSCATGLVVAFGKGGKTRSILLPPSVWADLVALRGDASADDAVFRSRSGGGPLSAVRVLRIVKQAAARAGLPESVCVHTLRHCHVSHALDHGAPPHLVAATVGHASLSTTTRYAHARPSESSARYLAV